MAPAATEHLPLRPDRWTIRSVGDRLAEQGDPFRVLLGAAQELPEFT